MAERPLEETEQAGSRRSVGEGVSESTIACLLAMVQGNLLVLTIGHLLVAMQTGFIAGIIAFGVTVKARINNHWAIALLLGISTTIIDYLIHPSSFGGAATEAIVTGLIAGLLSFMWLRLRDKDNSTTQA
jgi:hypothetical protein